MLEGFLVVAVRLSIVTQLVPPFWEAYNNGIGVSQNAQHNMTRDCYSIGSEIGLS